MAPSQLSSRPLQSSVPSGLRVLSASSQSSQAAQPSPSLSKAAEKPSQFRSRVSVQSSSMAVGEIALSASSQSSGRET
jgi:hypothetical protein